MQKEMAALYAGFTLREAGRSVPPPARVFANWRALLQRIYTPARGELLAFAARMDTAKPRILVVEDEAAIRDGLTDVLVYHGFRVDAVGDGRDGLQKALSGQYDLLLLDVMLPDGNGFDILAQLRGRPEFATLPIVLLTVKAELVHIRNGLALGADGYITKPYSKNQLAEVLRRVLKHSASAA